MKKMTRRSNLFSPSNSLTSSSSDSTPQPTSVDSPQRESEGELSGKNSSTVPNSIITPPVVSAKVADEEAAIRQEVERFRGTQSTGEFIAAVKVLLKIPDLDSADFAPIMRGEDPGFQLSLLKAARGGGGLGKSVQNLGGR